MTQDARIAQYVTALQPQHAEICIALNQLIEASMPQAQGKVWHGHPVWFVAGNPVAGYSLKKSGIQVLFWSGQSFATAGLTSIGKFRAAGIDVPSLESLAKLPFDGWFAEAMAIQWDYANLPKKRALEKLTDF